jgi:hypothetical protein
LPAIIRMAEVIHTGALWVKQKLTGDEVKSLMTRHRKTIAELSFLMGITQKRIRLVRNGSTTTIRFVIGLRPSPQKTWGRFPSATEFAATTGKLVAATAAAH